MLGIAFVAISLLLFALYKIIHHYMYSPFGFKTYQHEDGIYFDNYEPIGIVEKLALVEEPKTLTSKIHKINLVVAGYQREFLYYLPEKLRKPPRVVFILHGTWDDGRIIRAYTGYELDQIADEKGFIVAYPNGYCGGWNEIRIRSPLKANKRNVDDLAFFKSMIDIFQRTISSRSEFHPDFWLFKWWADGLSART